MNIIETGAELLIAELGLPTNVKTVVDALSQLLGDGVGDLDLASLAGKITSNGGLGQALESWLGDGVNESITADNILGVLGETEVADFATAVGTDSAAASRGLAHVIPHMMDQASAGGSLIDAVGGIGGLMGSAKSFLT